MEKQVNIMVDEALYKEYKACVKNAGLDLGYANSMVFQKAIMAEIAAAKKAGKGQGAKLFTDMQQQPGGR